MKRRHFLWTTPAGLAGLPGRGETAPDTPSDALRLGVIGTGHRGRDLIKAFKRTGTAEIVALSDVNPSGFKVARFLARGKPPTFADHRRMLDEVEMDAVVIASPHSFHAEQARAALESGRHVYCEIALTLSPEESKGVAEAVSRTGRQLQVGHQYRYAPWVRAAVDGVRKGEIGQVRQIHAIWHRNDDGRARVRPGEDERLVNWRLYRELSGGLLADRGNHQIDLANQVFDSTPESVTAAGGVDFWKDGRDVADSLSAVFRYPGGRTLVVTALTTNSMDGAQTRILGTDGSIVVTNVDATLYWEPRTEHSAHQAEPDEADASTGATRRNEVPYHGPGDPLAPADDEPADPDRLACAAFVDSVRTGTPPLADVRAGVASADWAARARRAMETGSVVRAEEA